MNLRTALTALACAAALIAVPATPTTAAAPAGGLRPAAAPATTATPDYDGDGKADLAFAFLGDWEDNRLRIEYGSGETATITAQRTIGDEWGKLGSPLLARDFDADGYTDLAFAAGGLESGEHLCQLFGSATGLTIASLHCIDAPGDEGVGSLALVESPTPRLVVGASYAKAPTARLSVYALDADGHPSGSPTSLRPGSGTVPKLTDAGSFGDTLASAGTVLYVGAGEAKIGSAKTAGAVVVLTFGASGVTAGRVLSQATTGVAGTAEKGDGFGSSVSARDGVLVVGTPGDKVGKVSGTGSVQVFDISGAAPVPGTQFSQASPGVPGAAERRDGFGASVAVATVCPGVTGFVVGAPGETMANEDDYELEAVGSAWVIPLAASADCAAQQLWEGHGLGGEITGGRGLGEDVAAMRDAGAAADLVAIAGGGLFSDMSPIGALALWSGVTQASVRHEEECVNGLAGR